MEATDKILDKAISDLRNSKIGLDKLLKEHKNTDIGIFVNQVLEWYNDRSRPKDGGSERYFLLWCFLHEAVEMEPTNFMKSFCSFVGNCLLDDAAFIIEWRIPKSDSKYDIVSENTPDADPVVVADWTGSSGTQDVKKLLKAMDSVLELEKQRKVKFEKFQEIMKKISRI